MVDEGSNRCFNGMAVLLKQVVNKPGALAIKFTHFSLLACVFLKLRGWSMSDKNKFSTNESPTDMAVPVRQVANYPEALA